MNSDKSGLFIVELPAGVTHFLAVYEPWKLGPDMPLRYGLSFPVGYVTDPYDLDGVPVKAPREDLVFTEPYVSCSSGTRPDVEVIGGGSIDCLVLELQRLNARNLPKDRLFKNRALQLTLQAFDYNTPYTKALG